MQTVSTVMLVRIASSHKVFSLPSRYLLGLWWWHVGIVVAGGGFGGGVAFRLGGGPQKEEGTSNLPFATSGHGCS